MDPNKPAPHLMFAGIFGSSSQTGLSSMLESPTQSAGVLQSAAVLRSVMSAFPSSVVAIASTNPVTGSPTGLTVGTFTSISLDPPLAGFFVDKKSTSWPLIKASENFCASLLSHKQQKLARQFATRGTDKFAGVEWRPAPSGSPIIEDSLAWVDCVDLKTIEIGDHLLVLGTIIACEASNTEAWVMGFHRSKMGGMAIVESLPTAAGLNAGSGTV